MAMRPQVRIISDKGEAPSLGICCHINASSGEKAGRIQRLKTIVAITSNIP